MKLFTFSLAVKWCSCEYVRRLFFTLNYMVMKTPMNGKTLMKMFLHRSEKICHAKWLKIKKNRGDLDI